MLQTFKCCGYCRVLKNVENVARIKKKIKNLLQCCRSYDLLRMWQSCLQKRGLPNVAKSLKNVANDAQPTKIV